MIMEIPLLFPIFSCLTVLGGYYTAPFSLLGACFVLYTRHKISRKEVAQPCMLQKTRLGAGLLGAMSNSQRSREQVT